MFFNPLLCYIFNTMKNINHSIEENNSQLACELCCDSIDYDNIIKELQNNNIIKKQACLLNLQEIRQQSDADKLLQNLTKQDGRIRETTAFKINELVKENKFTKFFQSKSVMQTLLEGSTDVNPAICRLIIEVLTFINERNILIDLILEKLDVLVNEIEKECSSIPKHLINKKTFKLYWTFEALTTVLDAALTTKYKVDFNLLKLQNVIEKMSIFDDYTIREKVYKLLKVMNSAQIKNEVLNNCYSKLSKDENFYVGLN